MTAYCSILQGDAARLVCENATTAPWGKKNKREQTTFFRGSRGGAGAYPSGHRAEGRIHPGQICSVFKLPGRTLQSWTDN
ncbi:hypothetical protein AOLI_G00005650 [Acnodon oligacanthus]